jgi:type VI secretion system protein ImpH
MADHGRRADAPVADQLFAEGYRFDFYQAVALLEALAAGDGERRPSVGEGGDPRREAVRFSASVGLGFPPSDVVAVRRGEAEGDPAQMTVAFLSLVGALGPMPGPIVDLVQRSTVLRDFGPADFLDIFHHRLISLRYRVKKRHRPALGVRAPGDARVADYLYALIGLFAPPLRERLRDDERPLLHYAGLLSSEVRSMEGLLAILRHRFGAGVEGAPLTGGYRRIEERDQTRIGPSGDNRVLGDSAVLGRRAWDQQGAFELRVGPLAYADLGRYLPDTAGPPAPIPVGDALVPLCRLVRLYAGSALDFSLTLLVRSGGAPQATIGPSGNRPRLGYCAWIGPRRQDAPPHLRVHLTADDLRAAERRADEQRARVC